ncbi:MAG: SRPBCC family protein [Burkholderiales bacterium]
MEQLADGEGRSRVTVLPECLDDYVAQDGPVRVAEALADRLDLCQTGFDGVAQGRPSALPTTRRSQFDLFPTFERVKRGRTITDRRAGDLPPAERSGCLMTDRVKVDVRRSGRRFEAEAELELAADAQTVWDTITDYGALPRFMPGIHACRVIERKALANDAEHLVVEQQGEFRFLLFAQPMTVLLNIEHQRLRVAEAKAVRFDLGLFKGRAINVFEGRYELSAATGRRSAARVQLRYTALIGLRLPPPPSIGSVAVRQNLAAQLEAVAEEIARRSGRPRPTSSGR